MTRRALLGGLGPACVLAQYVDRRNERLSVDAPGRDPVEELGLKTVPVGFFGPAEAGHATGGSVYMGTALAFEEANERGGYRGKRFELVSRWADDPWRGGASAVVKMALVDHVVAVVGGIDGVTTHLAEQVVAKALVPLVDPASTDVTANGAGVNWMFSYAPGDPEIAAAMVKIAPEGFTLIAGTDHDSRMLAGEVLKAAGRAKRAVLKRMDVAPGVKELPDEVAGGCVVLIAGAAETRALVGGLGAGIRVLAGPAARSRVCEGLRRVESPRLQVMRPELVSRLEKRFGQRADEFAVLAYEAAELLIGAVREAGTARSAIRDRLAPHFGPRGRRVQEVSL